MGNNNVDAIDTLGEAFGDRRYLVLRHEPVEAKSLKLGLNGCSSSQ